MKALTVILFSFLVLNSVKPGSAGREDGIRPVWTLRKENRNLIEENEKLRNELDSLRRSHDMALNSIDSLKSSIPAENLQCEEDTDFFLSDSLLHVWYVGQGQVFSMSYDMETEQFSSNVSDEEFVRRLNNINSRVPLAYNDLVKNYCILYSEKYHDMMNNVMGLCEGYWPLFDEIFMHYGIPLELKALAIVESRLNPTAFSRMGAKGIWQFMYQTGKLYGLRIDSWTDERMDPVKSTEAAARYLKEAYDIFGDWNLAMASYNCGFGNVNKAIRRSGGKRDFWQIYDYLPRETRKYVPAFIGALYATHYYKEYGITPIAKPIAVPVDTFHVHRNLHAGQIAAVVGVDSATVVSLNPQYYHGMIPGKDHECVLRLPVEFTDAFIDAGDSLYVYEHEKYLGEVALRKMKESSPYGSGNYVVYKVKSGDVLGKIARRYGVSVSQLKMWNNLHSNTIKIGQKLRIYPQR